MERRIERRWQSDMIVEIPLLTIHWVVHPCLSSAPQHHMHPVCNCTQDSCAFNVPLCLGIMHFHLWTFNTSVALTLFIMHLAKLCAHTKQILDSLLCSSSNHGLSLSLNLFWIKLPRKPCIFSRAQLNQITFIQDAFFIFLSKWSVFWMCSLRNTEHFFK